MQGKLKDVIIHKGSSVLLFKGEWTIKSKFDSTKK